MMSGVVENLSAAFFAIIDFAVDSPVAVVATASVVASLIGIGVAIFVVIR